MKNPTTSETVSTAAERPFLDLPPLLTAAGAVRLPGSKSISNRALLLAALTSGTTRLRGLLASDDTEVMLVALRTLGCGVQVDGDDPSDVRIVGLGGRLGTLHADLFLGNSGTSVRSLTAAVALLCATQGGEFTVSGVPRMHQRPIADLVDALRAIGCPIAYLGAADCPPLRLGDGQVHRLSLGAPIRVGGAISSQFLTGLLLALPLVAQDHDVVVEVDGNLVSKPYIAITLDLLARFGVDVVQDDWQRFTIRRGAQFVSPREFMVEGDASSASYFIALGAIAAQPEAPLRIDGVGAGSVQGDVRFVEAARAMGADVTLDAHGMSVARGAWPLRPIDIDCNDIPDAAMTLAVMALYATGTTRLRHIGSWRVKETDRIAAMACELRKLGATVEEGPDWIAVTAPTRWQPAAIATYDDHRMAMCASLAAFNGLARTTPPVPVRILDPGCVAKTFPTYFDVWWTLVGTDPALVPVITIDGPTASGKGTVASAVAAALGYHVLDSGAAYRATALAALSAGIDASDATALARLAAGLRVRFDADRILLDEVDVTCALRDEAVGAMASAVSVHPAVRQALWALQLSFRRPPGLVADGRDMGTVVFPDASLKVFLTASVEMRARRRHAQLQARGEFASIDDLREAMEARDFRDRSRAASPLMAADGAVLLDNSGVTVEQAANSVLSAWSARAPYDAPSRTQR